MLIKYRTWTKTNKNNIFRNCHILKTVNKNQRAKNPELANLAKKPISNLTKLGSKFGPVFNVKKEE